MIKEETVSKIAVFSKAAAYEAQRAKELEESGLYTEATMRLGRAVEASLYAAAAEFEVSVVAKSIEILANLGKSLRNAEINVMRKKSSEEVRSLSNLSKRLAEAIAQLAEDESARGGIDNDSPRPNEQIFRDIVQALSEPPAKRRLEAKNLLLREIQDARNAGAHASLAGHLREIDKTEFDRVTSLVNEFLGSLFEVVLGERARKIFATTVDAQRE
jgi:hypothetical protein